MDTSDPDNLTFVSRDVKGRPIKNGQYWDADLQSYMYLQDFLSKSPNWKDIVNNIDKGLLPQYMDKEQLNTQIRKILDLAPEREERFMEIIDQDDADGAASYWLGMLKISPARHPATYLMVRVGRRIGEHVVMCLKGYFGSPRPSQLCPAIMPMIDPPATPSFPAGHAVQAYLISYLLAYSLPRIPQQDLRNEKGPLFDLAFRVSENRVVAGLHYPTDIAVGREVGLRCFMQLLDVPSVWGDKNSPSGEYRDAVDHTLTEDGSLEKKSLRARVQEEFPQYA